jgi:hypothetical protein
MNTVTLPRSPTNIAFSTAYATQLPIESATVYYRSTRSVTVYYSLLQVCYSLLQPATVFYRPSADALQVCCRYVARIGRVSRDYLSVHGLDWIGEGL